ncbi:hypothetical protein GCM10011504_54440 [Siccirubricoccus deserti]|uniref:Uncharacterized protein n=1 Tax=Siccirubricoccus deserti TaxID=2013562 RepID=A0A9X0R3T6_9PROT|nr:hypothetical protein [Siccirubricoccus deserti]MBC4018919.1 hypothetical protein [Siccirubricoccus deserti]GGC69663.1 hypothetical protein GCM10011504_54440 [Siccirubricoccus deserti]
MHGTLPATLPLLVLGCGPRGLALRCLRRLEPPGPLRLLCAGIEVGSLALPPVLLPDTLLEVPLHRLPLVPLPAEIRIACDIDTADLALPWILESAAAAQSILGPPRIEVADLRLDHGVLRGTGVEAANGLLQPVLYARVNGALARAVAVEPPVARPEGGCAFRFGLPLLPQDLTEAGLTIGLYLVGQEAPLANFAWGRTGPGAVEAQIARLEARLARLEQDNAAAAAALETASRRRLDLQQERIDSFIDAAATLLLDRLAGPEEAGDRQAALRALIGTLAPGGDGPTTVAGTPEAGSRQEIDAHAAQFGPGWHAAEDSPEGSFRWMTEAGLVMNPAPERPVTAVLIDIAHLYATPEPRLEVQFDVVPGQVTPMPAGPHGFVLRIVPEGGPLACEALRLASRTSGSPARDGASADARVLSVAVSRVVFLYAE